MPLSLRLILPVALAAGLLAGCASPSTSRFSRIDANRGLYESWPLPVQEAVLEGRAIEGMNEDMVRMALGQPDDVQIRVTPQGYEDIWVYRVRREDDGAGMGGGGMSGGTIGIGMGGGASGIHVGAPPIVLGGGGGGSPLPPSENIVIFQDGIVTAVRMDL